MENRVIWGEDQHFFSLLYFFSSGYSSLASWVEREADEGTKGNDDKFSQIAESVQQLLDSDDRQS